MSQQHWCVFKHIPSQIDGEQLAANIEKFLKSKNFDKNGIKKCGQNGNDTIEFSLRRDEADRLRDNLKVILPNINSPIWFGILTDPLNNIHIPDITLGMKNTSAHAHKGSKFKVLCQFGSLRSYNLFYSHTSLNNQMVIAEFKSSSKFFDSLHLTFEDILITIPFHSIQKKNILINKINEQTAGVLILISLQYAPTIYQLMEIKSDDGDFKKGDKKPVRICVDNKEYCSYIDDIANSCDIVFHFCPSENAPWTFLRHFLADRPYRYEINFSTFQVADWTNRTGHTNRPNPFDLDHASYRDRYALSMLTSLGYVFHDKWAQLTDKELKWNEWSVEERYDLCCFAAEQLTNDHGYDLTRTKFDYQMKKSREDEERDKDRFDSDKKLLRIALCTLTPLTTIFRPFEMSIGSRALRNPKFGGPKQFLLVHFRDEDNTRLFQINKNIKKRLKYSMSNGIIFMDKKFIFMGSSVGQMKEQAFWYVSLPSTIKDMNEAYEILGQFQKIKNIATYIARIGQYFSRTLPVGIRLEEVKSIQDIKSNSSRNYVLRIPDINRGPYCFTDGVGKVSLGLAGRIAQKMNLPLSRKEDIPSAYQIRVAGCKGMLAIDPDSTLNDYYIHVRDSMIKFESNDWDLEICDYARAMTLSLNNQVIRLLKDLGTHDGAFIGLQNITVAQWEVPEEQQLSGIDTAVQKSFSYASSKENLLTNRIPIPPSDGRNMFGVADETGVLKYGECFIQYSVLDSSYTDQREFKVVTGRVIVTKNPCLWPGDVRVLTAVSNNKLARCMRDVIVFPTTGNRPHSNEMAGSDLDGDQYWVYWGNELKVTKCVEPLSYKGAEKASAPIINHEIIIQHIVESFSAGIMMGVIANTHSVVADKHPEHSHANDCKNLAELFSLAVDSPKTGKFIDKTQIAPYRHKHCSAYPTFLRKYEDNSYESSEILGILYKKALAIWTKNATTIQIKRPYFEMKTAMVSKDIDKEFEKWLNQDTCKEVSKPNDEPVLTNQSKTASTSNTSLPTKVGVVRKSVKKSNNPPAPLMSTQSDSNIVIHSKAEASTDSTLSSIDTAATASQSYFNFLIVNNIIRSNSDVIFDRVMPKRYNVRTKNDSVDVYDRNSIIKKIITFLENVPGLNDKNNQSVELTIYFGYINFIEQSSFPKKYGDLKTLVRDNADQIIHFSYGNPTKMNILKNKFTKMKKNQIEYEFNCQLITDTTKYYTLLFSKSKHLEQIRVSRIYSKNYIRLPNLLLDNLYELRHVTIHNSDSTDFRIISDTIFRETSRDLLNDAQPIMEINQNVLRLSVVPISLKIIDEEQMMPLMKSTQEPRFRNIRYLLLNSEDNHVKILNTMEYRIHPISKNKDILKEICDEMISMIEPAAFSLQKDKIPLNKTTSMSNA